MKEKFFRFGSKLVKYLFYFLFLLTFYFAITSPNLILGDNSITGAGTTFYTTMFIILTVILLVTFYTYNSWSDLLKFWFVDRQWITASITLGLAVVVQIIFVWNMHPAIGFDPGALHNALYNTTDPETRGYYSLNPNNMPIMLLMHQLALFFHSKSWLLFDFITVFLVDLSALFNILCIEIINHKKIPLAMYIHALWLMLFPMIIVPYTDAWVLPLVSLYTLLYVLLRYGKFAWGWKIPIALLCGVSIVLAYFMKPSAIVGVIAIILIEFLYLFKGKFSKEKLVNEFIFLLIVIIGMVPTYSITNYAIDHQKYIVVNTSRAIPPIHFMSMGASGDGGYNAKDALMMAKLPNKQAQVDYSKKMLIKRLKKMGFVGYIKFLFKKHANNTTDGTFAWIKEGHFIRGNTKPSHKGFAGKMRNFFYLYGTNLGDFRYIAQVWWVFLLATIAFNWKDNRKLIQMLRLTIIGGFIFLLLFEGGRSRYLIQYLPAFLILATLSWSNSWKWIKGMFSWVDSSEKS
ncbi:TIGR03766 family XrtG-associated glycosyltransferase [Companilactobacillus nantensis]|uniref:Integral membrane protein n=1 Tax=Companilactobacillus nantensis DSM 16982 TaxID=1423774 RepID=A0A0R1WRW1_9LACO|nr:TIGR03766 family XrtG-associated glycosyltransferase [Companilactobacillus nantensis]KRM17843.1 integral membrane protein [Companilactobacillus nantensis DSM 16982]GEO63543.1 membrane protein [Companilactobacillus nantensis]